MQEFNKIQNEKFDKDYIILEFLKKDKRKK